jgi:hypothetical protein
VALLRVTVDTANPEVPTLMVKSEGAMSDLKSFPVTTTLGVDWAFEILELVAITGAEIVTFIR